MAAGDPASDWPRGGENLPTPNPGHTGSWATDESFIAITGIHADLSTGTVHKTHGPTRISDTGITGIENITGSAFDDLIRVMAGPIS